MENVKFETGGVRTYTTPEEEEERVARLAANLTENLTAEEKARRMKAYKETLILQGKLPQSK